MLRRTLNLGILAHVDAGKTTLTERLLYAAGIIRELGRVDDGTTQTDTLALEQQRGITIKAAVVSFPVDDTTVNLIDTPGHPDFIAEVERVLGVLDGAVLVVSAVEGVQAQTPLLMRALQRLQVPTLIFVNKTDRVGADVERVLAAITERLTPTAVRADAGADTLVPVLAEYDEGLLEAFVDGAAVSAERLRDALAEQTKHALVYPVFTGSAKTGKGIGELMSGIAALLPGAEGAADGPLSGSVFKIERGDGGDKIAYVRLFSGTLRVRERVGEQKVTSISVFEDGSWIARPAVAAGEIAKVTGLRDVRIGDAIGAARPGRAHHFPPPTLESTLRPRDPAEKAALRGALVQLAEQDPLIRLRQDDERQEFSVSLYGEVQKEVVQATLADEYGLEADFGETTTICIERPLRTAEAVEALNAESNPFSATIGLRVDPAPAGSGIAFRLELDHASVPYYLYKTADSFATHMDGYVRGALANGLSGWQVTDCAVAMIECGYGGSDGPPSKRGPLSKSTDFRNLTPLVLRRALEQAGTVVCEPIHRFHLEFPADRLAAVFNALGRLEAFAETPALRGSWATVDGQIRAARMKELQLELRGLTRGEGVLELSFDRYEPVRSS